MLARVDNVGSAGIAQDVPEHELPPGAWTDASDIRFIDAGAQQSLGYSEPFGNPSVKPYHTLPVNVGTDRYWIYAGLNKVYTAFVSGTAATHTNITRQTASVDVNYSATPNSWTSTVLGGVPILNPGNTVDPPQMWNLNPASRLVALTNWPANTYCKSLRAYKNFLVALNVTKGSTNYPYMVKWSHPADPGAVPISWNEADATKDAGEFDLAEGYDAIIDGLPLRDSLMIYKEASVWRLDFTGGQYVHRSSKVMGMSGAMNRNCITEIDGFHVVLTTNDIVVHDGVQATPILNRIVRRSFFSQLDTSAQHKAFVFKNPFFNEVYICFPTLGASACDRAVVYNYVDKTVSMRSLPNINHANYGAVDSTPLMTWDLDQDPWIADFLPWGSGDYVPSISRVFMVSEDTKMYLLDGALSYGANPPTSYVERRSLSFGEPDKIKLIKSINPRITGHTGAKVKIKVGSQDSPEETPVFQEASHVIGETVRNMFLVSGRYITIRFETEDAYFWRLSSYDVEYETIGYW